MIEVERKFRLDDSKKQGVLSMLENKTPQDFHQIDKVFLFQNNSFKNFKRGQPVIRIRSSNGVITLTYKRALNEGGDMLEHEVKVDSVDVTQAIVLELGYLLATDIEKKRQEFSFDNATVSLDEVVGLGTFLEIEIMADDEQKIDDAQKKVMEIAEKFGLGEAEIVTKKYDQLMEEKRS